MMRLCLVLLCSLVIGALPAAAHHSLSAYNRSQTRSVEGVVKEFRFANPHARIILLVSAQDGTTKEWDFEGGGVRRLTDRGISVNTIGKGDRITVAYNPMRSGTPGGFFVGFTTADGTAYATRR